MLGHEQRLTQRLLSYWQLIRNTNKIPQIEQFNSGAVGDLWQQCMMVSVENRKTPLFKYEFIGDKIIKSYGRDLGGQIIEAANTNFPGVAIYKKLLLVIDIKEPLEDAGFYLDGKGGMVKYRACFLPFGNETKGVTNVIVGLSSRAF